MKNFIALVLTLILCFSLCSCVGKSTDKFNTIGDTVENDLYSITLNNAVLTEKILIYKGVDFSKEKFRKAEEFFTPSAEAFVDDEGYVIEEIHGFSVAKNSGDVYLYYNFEFEYIGKTERTTVVYDFCPVVTYNDYTFSADYFSFYREKSEDKFSSWSNFDSDFEAISTVRALGLEIGYFNGTVTPLSNKTYEVRGIIPIPKSIFDYADATLTLKLGGEIFVIK